MPLSMDVHEITGGVAMDRVALAQACLEVPGHDVTGNRACFPHYARVVNPGAYC